MKFFLLLFFSSPIIAQDLALDQVDIRERASLNVNLGVLGARSRVSMERRYKVRETGDKKQIDICEMKDICK
jgi:hypothetical protein